MQDWQVSEFNWGQEKVHMVVDMTEGLPEEKLPKRFPLAFRRWIRESYYAAKINSTYDIGSRSRLANWMFNKETDKAKLKILNVWLSIEDIRLEKKRLREEDERLEAEKETSNNTFYMPEQLELFSEHTAAENRLLKLSRWLSERQLHTDSDKVSGLIGKYAVLKKKKRSTRGEGKRDRMEWGLFSKSDPKKVLKWFGPKKPSKKEVAKQEARIHAYAENNINKERN